MIAKHTNLISEDRIRFFKRRYYLRLLTVLISIGAILLVFQGILLLPTYLYARESADALQKEIALFVATNGREEAQSVSERIASLEDKAQSIKSVLTTPSVSALLRSVLAVPQGGIEVSRFSISGSGSERRMTISGLAADRESLRDFHASLQALSFVEHADLPLGAYALDSEIPFTITLTGPLTP